MTQDIKSPISEFAKLESGEQTFVLRLKEENHFIGANVTVREFNERKGSFTDRTLNFRITSMESGENHASVLSPRFVILSLSRLGTSTPQ